MTAIESILKAKSLSGLLVQVLVLHPASRGNQRSPVCSTTKPVVTVWNLVANADGLMMKTLKRSPRQSQQDKFFSISLSLKETKILPFIPKRQLLHRGL